MQLGAGTTAAIGGWDAHETVGPPASDSSISEDEFERIRRGLALADPEPDEDEEGGEVITEEIAELLLNAVDEIAARMDRLEELFLALFPGALPARGDEAEPALAPPHDGGVIPPVADPRDALGWP